MNWADHLRVVNRLTGQARFEFTQDVTVDYRTNLTGFPWVVDYLFYTDKGLQTLLTENGGCELIK